MTDILPAASQRVAEALRAHGIAPAIRAFPAGTRTAVDAARAIGCEVAQIVKSLIFRGRDSGRGVLVLASGPNRVDEARIAALFGEPIAKADAAFVRDVTGYAIGGVPPLGHAQALATYIDETLLAHPTVWAAAGTPNTVFPLAPAELERLTGGRLARVDA